MVENVRTTQIQEVPEWLRVYQQDILQQAQGLAGNPALPPEIQVAGPSNYQNSAYNLAGQGVGAYLPMLQAGAGTQTTGLNTLGRGAATASAATPWFRQGIAGLQGSAAGFDPAQVQAFMNPYETTAIHSAMGDLQRAGDIQKQGIRAQAVGAGAFGGSRAQIAEQEHDRNVMDQQMRTSAAMRHQGYTTSMGQAQQAHEAQKARQQSQAQITGSLAGDQSLAGARLGSLGQAQAGVGMNQAQLGEAYQGLNLNDVNTFNTLGVQQQSQRQAELDAARQNAENAQMQPYQQLGFYSDIYQGMPSSSTTLTNQQQPSPSMLSQLGGLGMGIYGLSQANQYRNQGA